MSRYHSKNGAKTDPMAEIRQQFTDDENACHDAYQDCRDDIRFGFVPGEQWDKLMRKSRRGRSQYEFNKCRPAVKTITNDMRQNSPSIKIRATEDSHKQLADAMQGLIRNIEANSRADQSYDTAGFYAVAGGYGVIEVTTEYSNDDAFDQDIRIREKRNPFAIIFDCNAKEFDKRDGRRAWEVYTISRAEFKRRYPKADPVDFSTGDAGKRYGDWFTEKEVRIAKYWCKHAAQKTIYQLSDGRVVDEDDYQALEPSLVAKPARGAPPAQPSVDPVTGQPAPPPLWLEKTRVVDYDRIDVSVISGKEYLEEPTDWLGKFIPLVPVWGDLVNIDGEEIYSGVVRPAKDSQRLFNYNICVGQEILANQPRAPLMYTPAMIQGHEEAYQGLATDNAPGLPYNVDPTASSTGGMPKRLEPPTFPNGLFEGATFASDLLKTVVGVVDGPIKSRASSGKAIMAIASQESISNYDYGDNLARAKAMVGEILVDLIPKTYDTAREVMILGEDGSESYLQLNQTVIGPDGQETVINDLSQGKYAVAVTTGPSFATRRMETQAAMAEVARNPNPQIAALGSYGTVKSMDAPGMDEVEEGIRTLLVGQGLLKPNPDDPPPAPKQPSPMEQAEVALKQAQAAKAGADVGKSQADAQNSLAEAHERMAMLPANVAHTQAEADAKGLEVVAATHPALRGMPTLDQQQFVRQSQQYNAQPDMAMPLSPTAGLPTN